MQGWCHGHVVQCIRIKGWVAVCTVLHVMLGVEGQATTEDQSHQVCVAGRRGGVPGHFPGPDLLCTSVQHVVCVMPASACCLLACAVLVPAAAASDARIHGVSACLQMAAVAAEVAGGALAELAEKLVQSERARAELEASLHAKLEEVATQMDTAQLQSEQQMQQVRSRCRMRGIG